MTTADEDAIFTEVEAFSAAWNGGDGALAASFFTDDAVRVGALGDRQQGKGDSQPPDIPESGQTAGLRPGSGLQLRIHWFQKSVCWWRKGIPARIAAIMVCRS